MGSITIEWILIGVQLALVVGAPAHGLCLFRRLATSSATPSFAEQFVEMVNERRFADAFLWAESNPSVLAQMLTRGLNEFRSGPVAMRDMTLTTGVTCRMDLKEGNCLPAFAAVAGLLALIVTSNRPMCGNVDPSIAFLSSLHTLFSALLAVACVIGHALYINRVDRLERESRQTADALLAEMHVNLKQQASNANHSHEDPPMLGAIVGDVIGSVHEGAGTKTKHFPLFAPGCRFTDDTVLTVAVADCLLHGRDYTDALHDYFHAYPNAGFGGTFYMWALTRRRTPYQSWGNGSAMRVSPVAYVHDNFDAVLAEAERSAAVTHDHEQGVRGAQATAAAVFLARTGASKDDIRQFITERFDYFLDETMDELHPTYQFEVSCQQSVPQSILAFLESTDYEDAVRNAISLGGDADTMACIAGAIAEAYYGGVPEAIAERVTGLLDESLAGIVSEFRRRYMSGVGR